MTYSAHGDFFDFAFYKNSFSLRYGDLAILKMAMVLIRPNRSLNIKYYVRDPGKAHPWAEVRVFGIFSVKIGPGALAAASCKNRKH